MTALDRIVDRLKAAGLPFEVSEATAQRGRLLEIRLPNGREQRSVRLTDSSAEYAEQIKFEEIVFLGDFDAFLQKQDGTIEARLGSLDQRSSYFLQRLLDTRGRAEHELEELEEDDEGAGSLRGDKFTSIPTTQVADAESGITIEIGRASENGKRLFRTIGRHYALRITGVKDHRHDKALSLLTRLANAYLFSLNLETGIALALRVRRQVF